MRQWHVATQLYPTVSRPNFFGKSTDFVESMNFHWDIFQDPMRITPLVSASNHDQPWQMESEAPTHIPKSKAKEHQQLSMLHQWCPPYCWNHWISNLALAGLRLCHMCPSWPREICRPNKWAAVIHRHRSCHCGPHQSDQSQPSQEKDGY